MTEARLAGRKGRGLFIPPSICCLRWLICIEVQGGARAEAGPHGLGAVRAGGHTTTCAGARSAPAARPHPRDVIHCDRPS